MAIDTPKNRVRPNAIAALRPSLRRAAYSAHWTEKADMIAVIVIMVGMYVPTCTPLGGHADDPGLMPK